MKEYLIQDKFYYACKIFNFEYIDKILNEDILDTSGVYNNPCIIACSAGNLDSFKHIINKLGSKSNIEKWDSYGFRWACSSGNLDLVKYLLELRPEMNIASNSNIAFKWACETNQLNVVKWFHEIDPVKYDYKIVTETKTKIVRTGVQNTRREKSTETLKKLLSSEK